MAYTNKVIRNPKTGQSIRFIRTSRDTDGQLLEMESAFQAGSTRPAAHYHPQQTEDFTVTAGELTVHIDGKTSVLRRGDTLHVLPNTVHSMWNASTTDTVVNWQVRPALDTEYFFETVFGLANNGKTGSSGKPPFLQTVLLARHFASVFRLAKPARPVQELVFGLLSPLARLAGYRATNSEYFD